MRHRKLNRLRGYNYSQPGGYFVTICVKDRIDHFGKITGGKVVFSEYGQIANVIWLAIDKHYHNVDIDQYVIMPNHIHGIIFINHSENVDNKLNDDAIIDNHLVSVKNYGLLSKVIKSFKNEFTKAIRENNQDNLFQWQRSYYDHIIRNEEALCKHPAVHC